MLVKLHHVEFLCNNISKQLGQFCSGFGFKPFAEAFNPTRIALKRNSICFVLTEDRTPKNTVSNITFELKNVRQITNNAQNNGGEIISPLKTSKDPDGHTISTVIQSPCGNVVHTLLDKSNYSGVFLPGFIPVSTSTSEIRPNKLPGNSNEDLISHIDHIAFACHRGTSLQIIDWYSKCLGFKRFQVNADEADDGYAISSLVNGSFVGLKLAAMQYWKCSEIGIEVNSDDSRNNVKFVLAESLPGQGMFLGPGIHCLLFYSLSLLTLSTDTPNQIQTFLDEHGGPGVHHIGLHSRDMVGTIKRLKNNGVEFVAPPEEYYTQVHDVIIALVYCDTILTKKQKTISYQTMSD